MLVDAFCFVYIQILEAEQEHMDTKDIVFY